MDYSELFLSLREPEKQTLSESIYLNAKLLYKLAEEGFSKNYKPLLTDDYYPEERIVKWLDVLSQTPGYKWFKGRFRPALHDISNIPEDGSLLVSNHNSLFIGDVAPIYLGMYEKRRRVVYGLGHNLLKDSDFMKSVGGTHGRKVTAIKLLDEDKYALVCPEGALGAGRSKLHAYHVRPIEGFSYDGLGYLKVAYRSNKPIIPIGSVGGEETSLVLANIKPEINFLFNTLEDKLNISQTFLGNLCLDLIKGTKLVPLLLAPPLPLKIDAYVGKPIEIKDFVDERERQIDYYKANMYIMNEIQKLIDKGLEKRSTLLLKFYQNLRKLSIMVDAKDNIF